MDNVKHIFQKVTGPELKPVDWRANISKHLSLDINPLSWKWQMGSRPVPWISDITSPNPATLFCMMISLTTALHVFLKKSYTIIEVIFLITNTFKKFYLVVVCWYIFYLILTKFNTMLAYLSSREAVSNPLTRCCSWSMRKWILPFSLIYIVMLVQLWGENVENAYPFSVWARLIWGLFC